jgi:hypothetical protein
LAPEPAGFLVSPFRKELTEIQVKKAWRAASDR